MKTVWAVLFLCVAVTAAPHWNATRIQGVTNIGAVAFSDEMSGIVGVSREYSKRHTGRELWLTKNGGLNWDRVPCQPTLVWTLAAATGNSFVIGGMDNLQYGSSSGGQLNFQNSSLIGMGRFTARDLKARDQSFFAAIGSSTSDTGKAKRGFMISRDGGKTFQYNSVLGLKEDPHAGAYPTAMTWYIAAGGLDSARNWSSQIVKTVDGGQTWKTVWFDSSSTADPAGLIDCEPGNTDHCCASFANSLLWRVTIRCTDDGGQNWKVTYQNTNPGGPLMTSLRLIDAKNAWAAGGGGSSGAYTGAFWQSVDGGQTWTITRFGSPDTFVNSMSWPSAKRGFATSQTAEFRTTASQLLIYT